MLYTLRENFVRAHFCSCIASDSQLRWLCAILFPGFIFHLKQVGEERDLLRILKWGKNVFDNDIVLQYLFN